jgi:selenocysteine-specific translation elongation factor
LKELKIKLNLLIDLDLLIILEEGITNYTIERNQDLCETIINETLFIYNNDKYLNNEKTKYFIKRIIELNNNNNNIKMNQEQNQTTSVQDFFNFEEANLDCY